MWIQSAIRSLLRSKLRTIFTLFSIVIGTASFFCMFLLVEMAPQSIHNAAKTILGGDMLIQSYLEPITEEQITNLFSDSADEFDFTGTYVDQRIIKSDHRITSVIMKGIDPSQYPYYGDHQYENIRSLSDNEILLSEKAADRLQVNAGDNIYIPNQTDGNMSSYRVKGLVYNVQESYGDANIFGAAYLPLNEALTLFQIPPGSFNEILISSPHPSQLAEWKDKTLAEFESAEVTSAADREHERMKEIATLFPVLQLFSLLALGIGAITVSNTLRVTMISRMNDIAAMKAVGLKNKSIANYFLTEGVILGLVGTILGILFGLGISVWLTDYLGKMLSIPLTWELQWNVLAITLIVGILTTLVATWIPLRSMLSISPMQLLHNANQEVPGGRTSIWKKIVWTIIICLGTSLYLERSIFIDSNLSYVQRTSLTFSIVLLTALILLIFVKMITVCFSFVFQIIGAARTIVPPRWYLPFHNLSSSRKQYSSLAVILAIGVSSFVITPLFADNFISTIKKDLEQQAGGSLLVTSSVQDEKEVEASLKSLEIDNWIKGIQLQGFLTTINGSDAVSLYMNKGKKLNSKFFQSTEIPIEGIDPSLPSTSYDVSMGSDFTAADTTSHSVLLLEDFHQLGIEVGDHIAVQIGSNQVEFDVIGFFASGLLKTVSMRVPLETLMEVGSPSRIVYTIDSSSDNVNSLLSELNQSLPQSATAYSISDVASDSLNYNIKMVSVFFSIVALFAFTTAVLTIGNQIVIRLLLKNKEIAIIKTIGMSSSKIKRSLLLENLILSLLAGITGVGASLLLAMVAIQLLFHAPMQVNASWLFYGICLSVVTTLAVTWIASRQSLLSKPMDLFRKIG